MVFVLMMMTQPTLRAGTSRAELSRLPCILSTVRSLALAQTQGNIHAKLSALSAGSYRLLLDSLPQLHAMLPHFHLFTYRVFGGHALRSKCFVVLCQDL